MNRIAWIDNWKGFMLLVVFIGHFHVPIPYFELLTPLHVASFFFLSGVLYDECKYRSFTHLLKSKCASLLIPFFALSLLFLLISPKLYDVDSAMYVQGVGFDGGGISSFSNSMEYFLYELKGFLLGSGSVSVTGPLWFLKRLFIVEMLLFFTTKPRIVIPCMLLSGVLGYLFYIYDIHLFWGIDGAFTALAISLLGYRLKHLHVYLSSHKYLGIVLVILCGMVYLLGLNIGGTIGLIGNGLCRPWYGYIMVVVFGLLMWYGVFVLFSNVVTCTQVTGMFSFVARNGIVILAVHYYAGQLCRTLFPQNMESWWFPYSQLLSAIVLCGIFIPLYNMYMPSLKRKLL